MIRAFHDRRRSRLAPEWLETRSMLAADLMITEVVSNNTQGLEDEDGDDVDWIEIYNAGNEAANLAGWHLTDDVDERQKWTFPTVTMDPQTYLIVFASGKNRRVVNANLHTNFRLDADGEYLALVGPDGQQVKAEFAPAGPALLPDRSFGFAQAVEQTALARSADGFRYLVPTVDDSESLQDAWRQPTFNDVQWPVGVGAIGFGDALATEVGTNVGPEMSGMNSSVFVRLPFSVEQPNIYFDASLKVRHNDGYVAFLNGQEISRSNAPSELEWDSVARSARSIAETLVPVELDLSPYLGLLQPGDNLLAFHGLNRARTSGDFFLEAELLADRPGSLDLDVPRFFASPTPGRANGQVSYAGLIPEVVVATPHGFYDEPIEVTIASATIGASLVITTDGSEPTLENGTTIVAETANVGPSTTVAISTTTSVRAAAFKDDYLSSRVDTQTYLFLDDIVAQDLQATVDAGFPQDWKNAEPDYGLDADVVGPNDLYEGHFTAQIKESLAAIPTISLVTDIQHLFDFETGIYMNSTLSGSEWERPVSIELIHPDGSQGFQENAGVRIQGDNVRNLSGSRKQSLRVEFRESYGPTKLRYPLFGPDGAERFDTLMLRGLFNDRWVSTNSQYIRDQWARETILDMGHPSSHGIFVHLYLNGIYWGMYNVIERPNASFAASYFGGNKDDWDALNTGAVRDGTDDAWRSLRRDSRDVKADDVVASNTAYLKLLGRAADGSRDPNVETLLDVTNYIDYLIMNMYGGNNDWPQKNYYVARERGPASTGFKFFAWDTEKILDDGGGATLTVDRTDARSGVADMFASLRTNAEFRLAFGDRVHRHLFNDGALFVDPSQPQWDPDQPQRNLPASRYDRIAQQVSLALIGESARWGDSNAGQGPPLTTIDWQRKRDDLNARFFPQRSSIVLEQFIQAGLYPSVEAPTFSQHGGSIENQIELIVDAPSAIYVTLDGSDPRQPEWVPGRNPLGVSPTAVRYTEPIPLDGDVIVRARAMVDGEWSALNEATFIRHSPLTITELMYHPRDPDATTRWQAEDFEFIELHNSSESQAIDLAGHRFTRGIEHSLAGQLQPNERGVVVSNREAFQSRYGTQVLILGEYDSTARLANDGEIITLVDSLGRVIDDLAYSDQWYPTTDGPGHSLTSIRADQSSSELTAALKWRASWPIDGSPGADDSADFNGDGHFDQQDVDVYCAGHRQRDARFDMIIDGVLDRQDLAYVINQLFETDFGDHDLDGKFTAADLDQLLAGGTYDDGLTNNSRWSEGDWNCDGEFDSRDLVFAFTNGQFQSETAEVEGD